MSKGFYADVVAALKSAGYSFRRSAKGSHEIWQNEEGRQTTVPRTLKSRHTANDILKQAGLPKSF